jgi:hypothetical protein
MNGRVFFQHRHQEPGVSEPAGPRSAEPNFIDPYAEKRRRAVELLGERYILHPAKALHRWSSGAGSARGMRNAPH